MGTALKDKGDPDAAIESYKKALKIQPDFAEVYNNMGTALKDKGDPDAAIESYKKALKIQPDYAEAYNNMGSALKDKGDPDAAIESYKKALKIQPDYAEIHHNMGVSLQVKGEVGAAVSSHKQALKIKPDLVEAANYLAKLPSEYIGREELNLLQENFNNQVSNKENHVTLKFLAANILRHKGDVKGAFNKFSDANRAKAESIRKFILEEQLHNNCYLEKLKNWTPNPEPNKLGVLKKLFILGPSRSGKTSLETLLSKSRKVKPLGESIKLSRFSEDNGNAPYQKIDFNEIFYHDELTLKMEGFEVVLCTSPNAISVAMEIFDRSTDCYFIFLKRDQRAVASEIFTTNYTSKNFYSYDPTALTDYLQFYDQASQLIQSKVQGRALDLSFEEVVGDPHQIIKKISTFLSIDFGINKNRIKKLKFTEKKEYHNYFCNLSQFNSQAFTSSAGNITSKKGPYQYIEIIKKFYRKLLDAN